jgi:hypothetical protein
MWQYSQLVGRTSLGYLLYKVKSYHLWYDIDIISDLSKLGNYD